jgi:hypothetical protein
MIFALWQLMGASMARLRVSKALAVILGSQESRKMVFVVW